MRNVTYSLPNVMLGSYSTVTYGLEIMTNSLIMVIKLLLMLFRLC